MFGKDVSARGGSAMRGRHQLSQRFAHPSRVVMRRSTPCWRRSRQGTPILARPSADGLIAREGPAVACLFVRPQRGDTMRSVDRLQDLDGVTDADDEWLAEFAQFIRHISQAVAQEGVVPVGDIGLPP